MCWLAFRRNFTRWRYLLLLALVWAPSPSHAMTLDQVGEIVIGASYNEVSKMWMQREISLWAGLDASDRKVFTVRGETLDGVVEVQVPFTKKNRNRLAQLLTTGREWARKAAKNRTNSAKVLGCFPRRSWLCDVPGVPGSTGQMAITFWSTHDGQRSHLILDLVDGHSRCCKRTQIYVDAATISSLIDNVKHLDSTMKKILKQVPQPRR